MNQKSKFIRSRAPLRISLAGGGTDVSPYTEDHGGAILSMTIDRYAYAQLNLVGGSHILLQDLDNGETTTGDLANGVNTNGQQDLAKAVINRFNFTKGFELKMNTDVPWGSGLGSSSAHVVSVVSVFSHWLNLNLSPYELADLAYQIERIDLGQLGGRQDQYAAAFGGFNFIEFTSGRTEVIPLRVRRNTLNELHYRMVLCDLGSVRLSSTILRDQIDKYSSGTKSSVEALDGSKRIAYEMRRALMIGDIELMAELLNEGWKQKKLYSGMITNPKIDEVYEDLMQHGAVGGKLLGAGGGGHMLFICEDDRKIDVVNRLQELNLELVRFAFDYKGATTWDVV